MDVDEVMRTTFAAREFTADPLPDATLVEILDVARFAPSGGNRQGWKVIVVRERATREALARLTEPAAKRYVAQVDNGENPWNTIDPPRVDAATIERTQPNIRLIEPMLKAPVVLVICVDLRVVASTDQYLDRVGVISGASIYPFAWSILLAARARGFGGTITTLAVAQEPELKKLLGVPPHVAIAAVMPLGRPLRQLTRLKRKPVGEFAMRERWGGPPLACILGIVLALTLALTTALARAQSWTPPMDIQRCPSKWGAGDERGAGNHMKPETVLRAVKLIKTGETIELGHELSREMPIPSTRQFSVHTKRTIMNKQPNRRGSNEELLTSEIGQVGTQLDGFAHQSIENSHYNCYKTDDIATRTGFTKLGIENVGTLITRGVLIDVAALKGVDMLGDTYEITVQDLQQALQRESLALQPGDAVIIHTGWGRLWAKDNARFMKSNPGIGVAAAEWLAKQDPMLVGADTPPVEVNPNPDTQLSLPVHQILLVVNGVHLLENLKLDVLAARRVYEFAFVMQPLPLKGFTGSPVAPTAIR